MSKTGLLGTSFRILESGRPMMGFFPFQSPDFQTCNDLQFAEAFYANTFMGILIRLAPGLLGFAKVRSCGFFRQRSGADDTIIVVSL